MSKSAFILLLFIVFGNIYFRDVFHWVWLILGLGFFLFIVWFHWQEKVERKKFNKTKES